MKIQDKVRDAARKLEGYFDLKGVEPKVVIVDDRRLYMQYHLSDCAIHASAKDADGDSPFYDCVVGEEVGHLLHHASNPGIFERTKRTKARRNGKSCKESIVMGNFLELVSNYAGLVYVEKTDGRLNAWRMAKYIAVIVNRMYEDLHGCIGKSQARREIRCLLEDCMHVYGYRGAVEHYLDHGDGDLAELASMPYDIAMEFMKALLERQMSEQMPRRDLFAGSKT